MPRRGAEGEISVIGEKRGERRFEALGGPGAFRIVGGGEDRGCRLFPVAVGQRAEQEVKLRADPGSEGHGVAEQLFDA